jgi:hypothetical protein
MEKEIGCRKLHNDHLCFLYYLYYFIKLTMEEEVGRAWHVTTWESIDMLTEFWWLKWKE